MVDYCVECCIPGVDHQNQNQTKETSLVDHLGASLHGNKFSKKSNTILFQCISTDFNHISSEYYF